MCTSKSDGSRQPDIPLHTSPSRAASTSPHGVYFFRPYSGDHQPGAGPRWAVWGQGSCSHSYQHQRAGLRGRGPLTIRTRMHWCLFFFQAGIDDAEWGDSNPGRMRALEEWGGMTGDHVLLRVSYRRYRADSPAYREGDPVVGKTGIQFPRKFTWCLSEEDCCTFGDYDHQERGEEEPCHREDGGLDPVPAEDPGYRRGAIQADSRDPGDEYAGYCTIPVE